MLRLDRVSIYIVMFGLAFLIPSVRLFDKTDELTACMLIGLAMLDMIANGNYHKYRGFLWLVGILSFYAIYSLFLPYNRPLYILVDWIIQIKSFACFFILLAIGPRFTPADKKWIRIICVVNIVMMIGALLGGIQLTKALVSHPAYAGTVIFTSAAFYAYASIDRQGHISRRAIAFIIVALLMGALCGRAKYFGSVLVVLYFIFLYKPGVMRRFNAVHLISLLVVCAGVIMVSWNKINYYFLQGESDKFDPEVVYSFARPVMFFTGGAILIDHFPLGTGLASFGTHASTPEMNYSQVYYEYGVHNVHGISPNSEEGFICDAFYPSLAQFGVVGVIIFTWFWVYMYSFLRPMARYYIHRYRPAFITGSCIIVFLLIESIGSTTLVQTIGLECLSLLGIICNEGRALKAPGHDTQPATPPAGAHSTQLYKI